RIRVNGRTGRGTVGRRPRSSGSARSAGTHRRYCRSATTPTPGRRSVPGRTAAATRPPEGSADRGRDASRACSCAALRGVDRLEDAVPLFLFRCVLEHLVLVGLRQVVGRGERQWAV